MNEQLKQYRDVFVQRISQGATKIYFGDVIKIFDQVLAEYQNFLQVQPGAPELPHLTTEEIIALEKKLHDAPEAINFADAESLVSQLAASKGSRGKVPEPAMAIDTTEPQPNAEVIARVKAHDEGVKAGRIAPPEHAELSKIPRLDDPRLESA